MKTIEEVLMASTTEVIKKCTQILLAHYKEVYINDDDFVYAVGDSPICVVAHVDTVRGYYDGSDSYIQRFTKGCEELPVVLEVNRNVITNKNGILGADDRAGVFGCLELVRRCRKDKVSMPSVLLTNGEESGGIGVSSFIKTGVFKRKDQGRTRLFVEMDRCNGWEWVTYGGRLPSPVIEYVESFGFKSGHGSYSDIADIQEEYLIPSVNLSIGYYRQHTDFEYLHLDEMWLTINKVYEMIKDPIDKLYSVDPKPKYNYGKWGWGEDYGHSGYNRQPLNPTGNSAKKNEDGKESEEKTGNKNPSYPSEDKGIAYIDCVLERITYQGYCTTCGGYWNECDCGSMAKDLCIYLEDEQIEFMLDLYLFKDDGPLYGLLQEYLKLSTEAGAMIAGDDPAYLDALAELNDPFHVGNDGEPVKLLPEP